MKPVTRSESAIRPRWLVSCELRKSSYPHTAISSGGQIHVSCASSRSLSSRPAPAARLRRKARLFATNSIPQFLASFDLLLCLFRRRQRFLSRIEVFQTRNCQPNCFCTITPRDHQIGSLLSPPAFQALCRRQILSALSSRPLARRDCFSS